MDTTKSGWRFWFSPYGRFTRLQYWKMLLGTFLTALAIGFVHGFATSMWPHQTWLAVILWAPQLAPFWAGACNNTRRLHDLGRSGWWQVAVWVLATSIQVIGLIGHARDISGIGTLIALGFAIALGAVPGRPGANRFDRLEAAAATA